MRCSMNESKTKIFHKVLENFAKIGRDLYVEAVEDGIYFRAFNSSQTSFLEMHFFREFFNTYQFSSSAGRIVCRVPLVNILRAVSGANTCILTLDRRTDNMTIQLNMRIIFVPILEFVALDVEYPPDDAPNMLLCMGNILSNVTMNFPDDSDVTVDASKEHVVVKNYMDDGVAEEDLQGDGKRCFSLQPGEFYIFNITRKTRITFSLVYFKAFLAIVEILGMETLVKLDFGKEGEPILCSIRSINEIHVEGFLLSATLALIRDDSSDVDR